MKYLLVLLLFTTTSLPQFYNDLRGIEDKSDNTHLFYRILVEENTFTMNSIYHLDLLSGSETLFLIETDSGDVKNVINDYEFWNRDPYKFIYSETLINTDTTTRIIKYTGEVLLVSQGKGGNIELSRQDTNIIYAEIDEFIYKTSDGGSNWNIIRTGILSSVSPFNHNLIFSARNDSIYKSVDGGNNFYLVSTAVTDSSDRYFYDIDGQHIYRLTFYDDGNYKQNLLFISTNQGEPYSWSEWSNMEFYLERFCIDVDTSIAGKLYLGLIPGYNNFSFNHEIYFSDTFGHLLDAFYEMDYQVNSIYAKPGTGTIYTATSRRLYSVTSDDKTLLSQLDINTEAFRFYPLKNGTKWVYNVHNYSWGGPYFEYFDYSIEVIGDTLMPDGLVYKQLKRISDYENYFYQRIDSTEAIVMEFSNQPVHYLWLAPEEGIILDYSPLIYQGMLESEKWGSEYKVKQYYRNIMDNAETYLLAENIGLSYRRKDFYSGTSETKLKGMILDGVVYGDTTLVNLEDAVNQPESFTLFQNYPNPFNPVTKIQYYLPYRNYITVKVYDMLGNQVSLLVNEEQQAGKHDILFNAERLSSGIYFYNISGEGINETRKMVLIK
jgi:hypothetical protein